MSRLRLRPFSAPLSPGILAWFALLGIFTCLLFDHGRRQRLPFSLDAATYSAAFGFCESPSVFIIILCYIYTDNHCVLAGLASLSAESFAVSPAPAGNPG